MTLYLTLFLAGILTILLPCILPLIPIVLSVSIAGRSKWRPVLAVAGMVVSFVAFTFLLIVVFDQFVAFADYLRIGTYYVLLLFGASFLTQNRIVRYAAAAAGAFYFLEKGPASVVIAIVVGVAAIELGGRAANAIQQWGTSLQAKARGEFGEGSPITSFIIGLTLGLVWVPCAGPALGFAFALVREEPGPRALAALFAYALGTAVPLLLIGYGGQAAVHSTRALSRYTGHIKKIAGALLIVTSLAFQFQWLVAFQTWLVQNTSFGTLGTELEERLFGEPSPMAPGVPDGQDATGSPMPLPKLPRIVRAPEFTGLGPWHNSEAFTLSSLKGKVVLVDFWTYSCINCIRTLPYIQGYWNKYKDEPFVLLGVHTPEFVFEKDEGNVADAIKRHGLTYPTAQDNDFGTWRAFANRYWPAKYLIDADGYIRYTHFGEGAYEETDMAIQSLLQEAGASMTGKRSSRGSDTPEAAVQDEGRRERSPETYLGSRSWPALGNANGEPSDDVVSYKASATMQLHKYYLAGDWQLQDDERQVLRSDTGEIRMKFLGGEINLVLGLEEGAAPGQAEVLIDGKSVKTFTVDVDDLYALFDGAYGEHELILRLKGKGVEGYAFTFGG